MCSSNLLISITLTDYSDMIGLAVDVEIEPVMMYLTCAVINVFVGDT